MKVNVINDVLCLGKTRLCDSGHLNKGDYTRPMKITFRKKSKQPRYHRCSKDKRLLHLVLVDIVFVLGFFVE